MAGSTVGTRVGPYTLVEEIGQGGFATVWLATDQEGNRVAIKRFEADHGKEVDREKAANERACLERLEHPNVLTMLDVVADEAGVDSLVLEYCEAGDLIHKMTRVVNGGAKNESESFQIWHQIIDGIGHMHERGVAHLDLKPQNVLLANEDAPCTIKVRLTLTLTLTPTPTPTLALTLTPTLTLTLTLALALTLTLPRRACASCSVSRCGARSPRASTRPCSRAVRGPG